jgi:hypothetical protein
LAAGIFFDSAASQIEVRGSDAGDVLEVSSAAGDLHVLLRAGRDTYEESFLRSSVRRLLFLGLSGDDQFDNGTDLASRVHGGDGNDRLIGGSSKDQIFGDAGNDVIFGGAGNDYVRGGEGADTLYGDAGNDLVAGDSGDDRLEGNDGNDRLYGRAGRDQLDGGAGADLADGDDDDDLVRGGAGDDRVVGGSGNDILLGGLDQDILIGDSGRDVLVGGPDKDQLRGGETGDILIGSTTDYDAVDQSLTEIGRVWASRLDYVDRVAQLQAGQLAPALVSEQTVHDDGVRDVLTGGSTARDWFFLPGRYDEHDPATSAREFLQSLDELADLSREEQVNSIIPHANNAVMRTEHFALFDLVSYRDATHTAIASGRWTESLTWQDGIIPGEGAKVLIPHDVHVTVDAQVPARLRTVRVDGGLEFATDRHTRLAVDTLVVGHEGVFRMGSREQPLWPAVSAELVITDAGPIDRTWDPFALSRGVIVHGEATVYGAEKTPFLPLAAPARRGARWLELADVPVNWNVGDKLVLAGTHRTEQQDEQLEILQMDGARVRVSPLRYNHVAAHDGLAVHLANLTRNASISSENRRDNRGHLMFMHTRKVDLNYLGVYHLGRTDKREPVNDSVVDADFQLAPGTGTNQRGRYAVHFHRNGVTGDGNPSRVHGSVVVDSRGWGYVNHSSFVELTDNVAYDVDGASFVTEAGDEIGRFEGNIAIHSTGSGQGIDSRDEIQDFGHQGDGFWFQGGGVTVVGNVAASQRGNGFVFFTRGLVQEGLGRTRFVSPNLVDASIANGMETIAVGEVPLREFRGNVAYSSSTGAATRFHKLDGTHTQQSVIEDLALWNNRRGLNIPYTNRLTVRNVEIIGTPTNPWGVGIDRNGVTRNITFENIVVEGFEQGVRVPGRGENVLVSGRLRNTQNIVIETAVRDHRIVRILEGVQMETARGEGPELTIHMKAEIEPREESVEHLFFSDTVLWQTPEGLRQIYFVEQSADFVPFRRPGQFIPDSYVGKTNRELWDEFGKAIGGAVAPEDAVTIPDVHGLVKLVS